MLWTKSGFDGFNFKNAVLFVWQAAARWTLIGTAALVVQSFVPLAILYVLKLVVDLLTAQDAVANADQLALLIAAAAALAILAIFCGALSDHASTIQTYLVSDHMQRLVQSKSIELDLAFYESSHEFDKLHRAQREAPVRPLRIVDGLTSLARNGLTMLGAMGLLATFNWGIVAGILVASAPIIYFRFQHADALFELSREKTKNDRLSVYLNRVLTTLDHAKEVRVFGFGPLLMGRYAQTREALRSSERQLSAKGARRQFVTESTAVLVGYAALAVIVHSAIKGKITLGEMVMFFGAFQVAVGSIRPTLSALGDLYENNLFLSALIELLSASKSVSEPASPRAMPRPWVSGIQLENLSFQYPGTDRPILTGVNMTIRPGEIVALVGQNGSGKTTLTKLLCRLYDPDDGRITIDGIDLREFSTEDLRREVSAIYQDFGRYQMSARDNILLGRPDLQPEDPAVVAAAEWAGIHSTLMRLPFGYDAILSRAFAGGTELSLGQWQKLALARAFVRESQLILLDEPTSSLDAASELEFFERFKTMAQGKSALIISHRFSTVRLADRIYVLEGGRVVEEGKHDELIAISGLYARLYRKQASYYDDRLEPAADEL